jgi:hypothetical protein
MPDKRKRGSLQAACRKVKEQCYQETELTKREHFAAAVLPTLLREWPNSIESACKQAVTVADCLIRVLGEAGVDE